MQKFAKCCKTYCNVKCLVIRKISSTEMLDIQTFVLDEPETPLRCSDSEYDAVM